jgi:hypothetical protein
MATLAIPEHAQNWLQDFLSQRSHCTDYHNERSTHLEINASIVQGSAIGPASYVVAAADLHAVTPGNEMCKYADDTYLIIPASNAGSISCEMENVAAWSRSNNLNINLKKTTEIIFYDRRRHQCPQFPPETPGITRTTVIKILGVSFTNSLSMSVHVQAVLGSSAQSLYAIKTLMWPLHEGTVRRTVRRTVRCPPLCPPMCPSMSPSKSPFFCPPDRTPDTSTDCPPDMSGRQSGGQSGGQGAWLSNHVK